MNAMNKHLPGTRLATWIYLLLLLLTGMTFAVGESGIEGLAVSLMVLALALLKGHLLGDHFMRLAKVRGMWRWVVVIWLSLPAMLIGTAFVLAAR
jgi:hypothetical protein